MEHSRYGRKLTDEDITQEEFDGEIIYDKEGNAYELSDEYKRIEAEQRQVTVDRAIELQLAKELLSSNLSRLTARQKDVLYYTMMGLKQNEIAVKLGIKSSVVKEHLERAKVKLAKIIEGTKQIMKEGLENGTEITDPTDNQS